jgi:hypothetical protein
MIIAFTNFSDAARFLFMPPILPTELSGNGNSPNGPHESEKAAGENQRSGKSNNFLSLDQFMAQFMPQREQMDHFLSFKIAGVALQDFPLISFNSNLLSALLPF